MSNNIDRQYLELVNHILQFGYDKNDRTGTGTKSIFGWQIRHRMSEGFPLLTTKKMAWKTMVTELLWFLRGDTNIKYLVDNDCHIWDGDAWKNFCNKHYGIVYITKEDFIERIKDDKEFAKKWGELGPIYPKQWRRWGRKNVINYDLKDVKGSDQPKVLEAIKNGEDVTKYGVRIEYQNNSIDQIANVINLLKTDPDSRRMIVNAWNVGELDQMVLPPCHMMFQFYTRELNEKEGIKKQGLVVKYKGNDCKIKAYHNANHELLILDTPEGDRIIDENQLDEPIDYSKFPTRAISLRWDQRSNDIGLGSPMNISSYSLLLMIIAKQVNMVPEEVIGHLGDCHIYNNHVDGLKEQLTRIPYELPTVRISDRVVNDISEYTVEDFTLENYVSHPKIYLPLSN